MAFVTSCSSDKPIAVETPLVELVEITTVDRESALVSYKVTGLELISHGVRYSTDVQDLDNGQLFSAEDGKVTLEELQYNTLYYVQAFAVNVLGSSKSELMSFITSGPNSFMEFASMADLRDYLQKYPLSEPEVETLAIGGELSEDDYFEIGNLGGEQSRFPNLHALELTQVDSIGSNSFSKSFSKAYTWLTSISAPNALVVKEFAFMDCEKLQEISFPKVHTLESFSLYNIGLKTFNVNHLPNVVTLQNFSISSSALISMELPSVRSVGTVLQGATNLIRVELGVLQIPEKMMLFSDAITELGERSFTMATSIGNYAFQGCASLKRAHFPLVTSIGSEVFSQCDNLTQLRFDSNIENIDSDAFAGFNTQECVLFINENEAQEIVGSTWKGKQWKAIFVL